MVKIKTVPVRIFVGSMVRTWCIIASKMLKLLDWSYFCPLAYCTMIISITLLILSWLFLQLPISFCGVVPKIFIYSQLRHKPQRISHDSSMPKNKIKKLFDEEFAHFECFCFSFPLCVNIYILCNWINVWNSICIHFLHRVVNLFQYTEMHIYFLVKAFNFITP